MALDDAAIQRFIATSGLSFVNPPPAYLDCSICQSILQEPVCCNSGVHVFCRKCLTDWMGRSATPHCPIDRDPLTPGVLRKVPQILQECIDSLEVVCSLGCGWKGGQSQWPAHLKRECPEVEEDPHEDRKVKTGDLPQALLETSSSSGSASDRRTRGHEAPANDILPRQLLAEATAQRKALNATCDLCGLDIFDAGYKCVTCPDYDLCSDCWMTGGRSTHQGSHAFVKLTDRADFFAGDSDPEDNSGGLRPLARTRSAVPVHRGITCDGCSKENISGVRYNCQVCDDFDLCQECVGAGTRRRWAHNDEHEMTRIVVPRRAA